MLNSAEKDLLITVGRFITFCQVFDERESEKIETKEAAAIMDYVFSPYLNFFENRPLKFSLKKENIQNKQMNTVVRTQKLSLCHEWIAEWYELNLN